MERYKNIVGPQVRRNRYRLGMKQKDLAAKLELAGWRIDRAGVSKIEARLVKVSDYQQIYLAQVLGVTLEQLFPIIPPHTRVADTIHKLLKRRNDQNSAC